jgi:hypothetical protein
MPQLEHTIVRKGTVYTYSATREPESRHVNPLWNEFEAPAGMVTHVYANCKDVASKMQSQGSQTAPAGARSARAGYIYGSSHDTDGWLNTQTESRLH